MTLLERLKQAEDQATPGPWTWTDGFLWNEPKDIGVLNHGDAQWKVRPADQEFIVLLRNHAAEIIRLVEAVADYAEEALPYLLPKSLHEVLAPFLSEEDAR